MADANQEQEPRPGEPQDPESTGGGQPEGEGRLTPEQYAAEYESGAVADDVAEPAAGPPAVTPPPPDPPALSPPSSAPEPEDDAEDEGMLRMSFMEHLEELRLRIIRALGGIAAAFAVCIFYSNEIWNAVRMPAATALKQLGLPGELAQITPTEAFSIIWIKLPVLAALFLASPWVLYQVWAFIAPGLYKKERRLAAPFILTTAGLFILGGCFAYFVAFRFGLRFLLGIGVDIGVRPIISMTEYTDLFINVMLGVGLVFELPVLIFFLTLLRIASPRFLMRHSRYAILLIVVGAAIITPTPDVYNLTIFAVPMILLYFIGVFASYLLVLNREGRRFPWGKVLLWTAVVVALIAAAGYMAMSVYHLKFLMNWPFITR
ncbi:MAG TPA: twin-arginine translocase subunit TatC [Bryobacteraceae bacterium]|nr:twin-arginine translocase subunit TatC [Bryobacteraceae bacterium]